MRDMMAVAACITAACNASEGATRSSLLLSEVDAGVGDVDADTDGAVDAKADGPIDCGSLCMRGDRVEQAIIEAPGQGFDQETAIQTLGIDTAGGPLEITLTAVGNFGTVGEADGVVITIGGSEPCPSQVREPGEGNANTCHAVLTVGPGHTVLPITLFQAGASSRNGWTVSREDIALVLQ